MALVEAVAKNKANQVRETNRQRMTWVEEKNQAAAAATATTTATAAIASTVSNTPLRRTTPEFTKSGRLIPYKWRSPSPHELGKRVIRGRPHTYNNNGSQKLDINPDFSLTPENAAAATDIAMSITGQKTACAALAAASTAAQAIMLQTITEEKTHDGTPATEITQSQANEMYRIQANLSNRATTIERMSSYLGKFKTQK